MVRTTLRSQLILACAGLTLASCAHYTPQPISDPGSAAVLQAPVAAVLSQQATEIDRPYLTPVSIDLSAPLNPNQIAIITVLSNPDLKAMRARAGVSDAQVFAAGLLPDPSFSMGIDEPVSGPPVAANIFSALGFSLNSLRTRSVLREQAKASNQQVRLDLAWAEWHLGQRPIAGCQSFRIAQGSGNCQCQRDISAVTPFSIFKGLWSRRYSCRSGPICPAIVD